ncbi:alpha/beta hydrolase [Streptomyces sp. NBC_00237]|uniref:alpha/beta fold hydrolase n=1 Tax=Streptomyces sp. NBC_00237 TaxID=2975687 RepID=UPI00225512BC|nr:alpha/beta fold hydrolase [Streptomyces sp. NBC_00237]MCX5200178.1 alpha/beta hydrolase [Streptomyces sp. NBC_00237]
MRSGIQAGSGPRSTDSGTGSGNRARRRRLARTTGLALTLAAALTLTSCGSPDTPTDSGSPTVARPPVPAPEAQWDDCPVSGQAKRECTTLQVPIDAAKPGAGKIDLAVSRLPATDRKRRIGVLVMDPGALGHQGLYTAAAALPPQLRALFDIVGFDRRGTGKSAPVDCGRAPGAVSSLEAAKKLPDGPDGPDGVAAKAVAEASEQYVADCRAKYGELVSHLGTADVTADLESIRLALREDKLNLLFRSYGTLLGQDYLRAHPARVRSAVFDATYDPGRTGTQHALDAVRSPEETGNVQDLSKALPYGPRLRTYTAGFRSWCAAAGPAECAISPDPQKTLDAVALKSPYLQHAAYAVMANPDDWPGFSRAVDSALDGEKGDRDDPAYEDLKAYAEKGLPKDVVAAAKNTPAPLALTLANHCTDFSWPRDTSGLLTGLTDAAQDARAEGKKSAAPGLAATYAPCAPWPQSPGGTLGLLTTKDVPAAKLAPKPLLVSTEKDPRTPLAGAQSVASRLPAALLKVRGRAHGSTLQGNACVNGHVLDTLVTGLPPKGGSCPAV